MQTGETEEAEGLLREALAGQRLTLGDRHGWTMRSMGNLAKVLFEKEELGEAEALAAELLELMPAEDPRRAQASAYLESIQAAREGASLRTKDD
jgi:cytochrome c-type biogenesis protein CcmH/NrfG